MKTLRKQSAASDVSRWLCYGEEEAVGRLMVTLAVLWRRRSSQLHLMVKLALSRQRSSQPHLMVGALTRGGSLPHLISPHSTPPSGDDSRVCSRRRYASQHRAAREVRLITRRMRLRQSCQAERDTR